MAKNNYNIGDNDNRPWGWWRVTDAGDAWVTKTIGVTPGARLSDQRHDGREEVWTIVQGEALVTLDGAEHRLSAGETIRIPVDAWHRIQNVGKRELIFTELQRAAGENGRLDEADIQRRSDDYGRVS